jgi:hypothetical protein
MTVITAKEGSESTDLELEEARARTRALPYGEIVGAVFPIQVGPEPEDKAWYQVKSLRPLRVEWLPYSPFQVASEALANLSKTSIYRLIEQDIFPVAS